MRRDQGDRQGTLRLLERTADERPPATPAEPGTPRTTTHAPAEPIYPPVSDSLDGLQHLDTSIGALSGVGQKREELFAQLGLHTVGDCLEYMPRYYLDRRRIVAIANAGGTDGPQTIEAKVVRHVDAQARRSRAPNVAKVIVYDGSGLAALVGFGNRATYLTKALRAGVSVVVSGKFKRTAGPEPRLETTQFEYEVLSEQDAELVHTGRLVPVYGLTAGLPQRVMRSVMARVVDGRVERSPEVLPEELRRRFRLTSRPAALRAVHFPENEEALKQARRRLVFEELLYLELGVLIRRRQAQVAHEGISFGTGGARAAALREGLSFQLTEAQRRVLAEIEADMRAACAMNRLLQGDVGSGKTVVGAIALAHAVDSGYQGALMAPTEVLAEQHASSLQRLLEPVGIEAVLLKGDMSAPGRRAAQEKIADGRAHVAVGTHALIQKAVDFSNLGLAIVDEQHRFGVKERERLRRKGHAPDVLVMTATPIPRTLALTAYGDLTLSVIDEMPPGRQPIRTKHFTDSDRDHLYRFIDSQIKKGRQAYIVYPLVEESEALGDIQAAVDGHVALRGRFPHRRIALLHGRLGADEKLDAMARFKSGDVDILVATTVIEVGIDVPNANVMVIENVERFGLSQVHQLRGRVGRGPHRSYCALVGWPKSDEARQRIDVLLRTNDGFEIAEDDLRLRGPGDILGVRQAGMPDLTIADLVNDRPTIEAARREAEALLEADPELDHGAHPLLREMVARKWAGKLSFVSIG